MNEQSAETTPDDVDTAQEGNPPESESKRSDESTKRMLPVYFLGFVLVLVLVFANVAIATDGTALDSDRTIETMDDAGVYGDVTAETRGEVEETIRNSLSEEERDFISDEEITEIVEMAVTEQYVKSEIDRNIQQVYEFLHSERDSVMLAVDLTEPRDIIVAELTEREQEQRPGEPEIAPRVEEEIEDQQYLTEDGAMPAQLDGAENIVTVIGTMTWLLPLLAFGLIGGIYHYSGRSLGVSAHYAGVAFVIAGVLGLAIGYVAGDITTSAIQSALEQGGGGEGASLFGAFGAVIENLFATIATYAWITTAVGVVGIGLAYADRSGHLTGFGGATQEPETEPEPGEPAQNRETGEGADAGQP